MNDKMQVITRKIKLYPIGNKEEVNRVYQFIRDELSGTKVLWGFESLTRRLKELLFKLGPLKITLIQVS